MGFNGLNVMEPIIIDSDSDDDDTFKPDITGHNNNRGSPDSWEFSDNSNVTFKHNLLSDWFDFENSNSDIDVLCSVSPKEIQLNQPTVELEDVVLKVIKCVSQKQQKKKLRISKRQKKKKDLKLIQSRYLTRNKKSSKNFGLRSNIRLVKPFQSPQKSTRIYPPEKKIQPKSSPVCAESKSKSEFVNKINNKKLEINEICLSCCTTDSITTNHPFFEGSLCIAHEKIFKEWYTIVDSDGHFCYCTICCAGERVVMCDEPTCDKVFCQECLILYGSEEKYNKIVNLKKWTCLLCDNKSYGAIVKRPDWEITWQNFFNLDITTQECIPPVPSAIDKRKPIRVLSLFDGIATGMVALKQLGLKIGKFVASEIDEDAIRLVQNRHPEVIHVGSICDLTEDQIKKLGPFDLVMGGSPCNDLSGANPYRQGLLGPSGCLFFDFYRVWKTAQPNDCACNDNSPFFWIFENVVSMRTVEKEHISRFLNCKPIVANADIVSAAKRPRLFWGNLPGMNKFKLTPSKNNKLNVQSCLEPGRTATVEKLYTITAQPKSLYQGKKRQSPVLHKGEEDTLWTTEVERIFGVPEHYTDVNNLGPKERLGLLGRSWSVPVVKQLFAPLQQYFALE